MDRIWNLVDTEPREDAAAFSFVEKRNTGHSVLAQIEILLWRTVTLARIG